MEKEYQILNYIQQQENATQRDIAQGTGIGLGHVNLLLKKMAKKGLVKIERLNAKSLRYILTPKGLREKTEKTYNYIKRSCQQINKVSSAAVQIAESAKDENAGIIYLYGPRDELYEIINLSLQQQKGIKFSHIGKENLPPPGNDFTVIVWRMEEEEKLPPTYRKVNILKELG